MDWRDIRHEVLIPPVYYVSLPAPGLDLEEEKARFTEDQNGNDDLEESN